MCLRSKYCRTWDGNVRFLAKIEGEQVIFVDMSHLSGVSQVNGASISRDFSILLDTCNNLLHYYSRRQP